VRVVLPLPRSIDTAAQHQQRTLAADDDLPSSERSPEGEPVSVRPIVIRIPECGGLPDAAAGEVVRGWLLLEVGIAEAASGNVRCLADDDAVDSSNMLRAEVRPSQRFAEESELPPSSRVARVSNTPRPAVAAKRVSQPGNSTSVPVPQPTAAVVVAHLAPRSLFWRLLLGMAILVVVVLLALVIR